MIFESTSVPTALWNADISNDAKKFYMFALTHAIQTGYAYFSNSHIEKHLGFNERKARRIMSALRDAKLIKTEIIDNTNRRIYPLYFGTYVPKIDLKLLRTTEGELVHGQNIIAKPIIPDGFSLPDWSKTIADTVRPTPDNDWEEQQVVRPTPTNKCPAYYNTPTSVFNTNYSTLHTNSNIRSNIINNITEKNKNAENQRQGMGNTAVADVAHKINFNALVRLENELLDLADSQKKAQSQTEENINRLKEMTEGIASSLTFITRRLKELEIGNKTKSETEQLSLPISIKATKDKGEKKTKDTSSLHKSLTKAERMKIYNQANHYAQYTPKIEGQPDSEVLLRVIHNTYPEVMSITKPLTTEQAEMILKSFDVDEVKDGLAYLNGFSGRNKYDNVYGALQSVISTKRNWNKK